MSSGKTFKATATPSLALLLNPLAWFLWILDFAIWVLTFGWVKPSSSTSSRVTL